MQGTGMGKTLISVFLMREFLACRAEAGGAGGKTHILFVVPSVTLAVQQTGQCQEVAAA